MAWGFRHTSSGEATRAEWWAEGSLHGVASALKTPPAWAASGSCTVPWESPHPARIGPYEVVGVLGEGGSGVVYIARQEPLGRAVAVKVQRGGIEASEALRRFEAERRVLAALNHPNIVTVFDAGETEDGRPYFVMEHVEGEAITEYCEGRGVAQRDRVRLVASVARALHHAHQAGVVHRDLKPGNVLVCDGPASPVAKVIDFGVAKVRMTDGEPDCAQLDVTEHGRLLGTCSYMSPEQAAGNSAEVDRRSDVYSLGLILRELLGAGRVNRDLGLAIARCLQPLPELRYQSALALAEDLESWLKGRSLAPRRRRVSLGAALVGLAAIVGLGAMLIRANLDSRRTYEAAKAELRTYTAEIVPNLHDVAGTAEERGAMLLTCERKLAEFRRRYPDDRDLDALYADVLDGLGDIENARREFEKAKSHRELALLLRRGLARSAPEDADAQRRLGLAHVKLSDTAMATGRFEEARALVTQAGEISEQLYARTGDGRDLDELVWREARLSWVAAHTGDADANRRHSERRVQIAERQVEVRGGDAPSIRSLGMALLARGQCRAAEGRHDEWASDTAAALDCARKAAAIRPRNRYYQMAVVDALAAMGGVAKHQRRPAAARAFFKQGVTIAASLYTADANDKETCCTYAMVLGELASLNAAEGRKTEALGQYRRLAGVTRRIAQTKLCGRPMEGTHVATLCSIAKLAHQTGDYVGAAQAFEEALGIVLRVNASPQGGEATRGVAEQVLLQTPGAEYLASPAGQQVSELGNELGVAVGSKINPAANR